MEHVVIVPRHCVHCGGAICLFVRDWDDSARCATVWRCPYCQREDRASVQGFAERVTTAGPTFVDPEDPAARVH